MMSTNWGYSEESKKSDPLLLLILKVQQTNLNKAVFYPLKVCTEEIPANCFKTTKMSATVCDAMSARGRESRQIDAFYN